MSRRTVAGRIALGLAAVLVVFAAMQPVPYVRFSPGPTVNVLGDFRGEKVVEISGHPVYPADGALRLLTVSESGPAAKLSLLTSFVSWVKPSQALLPREFIYKDGETPASVQEQSALQMTSSQDNATVVGLRAAGISFKTVVLVGAVAEGGASDGVLQIDDELLKVNGKPVQDTSSLITLLRALPAEEEAKLTIRRGGAIQNVTLTPKKGKIAVEDPSPAEAACPTGKPVPVKEQTVNLIGINPTQRYEYPFHVKISLGNNIGGPSAGMIFALSIYDLLTPGSLTGGKNVAGTGTVSSEGIVGAIGGIAQKMIGAQDDGARLFLVPSENWSEAINSSYDKSQMKLVRVHTVQDALTAINTWREDPEAALPGCAG